MGKAFNPRGMSYAEKIKWARDVEKYLDALDEEMERYRKDNDERYMRMQDFFRQMNQDLTMVVLGRVFDFSEAKCVRFADEISKMWVEWAGVWNGDTIDMEYSHEDLDRALREILQSHFVPYEKRYEGLLTIHNKGGK